VRATCLIGAVLVVWAALPLGAAAAARQDQPQASPPPAEKAPATGKPRAGESTPPTPQKRRVEDSLDPETLKKIDDLLQQEGKEQAENGAGRSPGRLQPPVNRRTPTPRHGVARPPRPGTTPELPGSEMVGPPAPEGPEIAKPGEPAGGTGEANSVHIVPEQTNLAPEQRQYGFSIADGSYEDLLEGFSRQTGLGVLGDVPKGKVKFVSTEMMDFKQALGRIRMLLFKYKPLEPYWLWYTGDHLEVIRVTDFYRLLPREQMFKSVEEFRAAHLPEDELALVIYWPKAGSVSDLSPVRDFMPDYVRIAPLQDKNAMTIFALASDIEKYLGLIEFFTGAEISDPRPLVRIPLRYVLPSQALEKLRMLMDLQMDVTERGGAAVSRRRGAQATPGVEGVPPPPVSILPDDAQMVLIVRAMQDKIDEMTTLLAYIDVEPGAEPGVTLIELKHADPTELVAQIQQILASTAVAAPAAVAPDGQPAPAQPRRSRRGRAAGAAGPLAAGGVTLIPVPASRSIAVIAPEEDVARVRELVAVLDVSNVLPPQRHALKYATAAEVVGVVLQLWEAGGKAAELRAPARVIPDPQGNAIWISGTRQDVDDILALVATLDVETDPVVLHVYRLLHQKPSFVANMLRQYESEASSPAVVTPPQPAGEGGRRRVRRPTPAGGGGIAAAKFTPEDETGRLYVLCTQTEWDKYIPLIEQLDKEAAGAGDVVRVTLEHVAPEAAVAALSNLVDFITPERVRLVPLGGDLMVLGASDTELARLRELLKEVDQAGNLIRRTFEIKYAEPTELIAVIQTFFGEQGAPVRQPRQPRRGRQPEGAAPAVEMPVAGESLSIMQMGNSLIVRTTPERMEEVAALIAEFDVERKTTEMRVYDFPPGTDFDNIVTTLTAVFRAGTPGTPRGQRGAGQRGAAPTLAAGGPTFIPQPAARKLVVVAEKETFAEIEELLDVLRYQTDTAIETAFLPVEHAEPQEVIDQIEPLLRFKVRLLVQSGELEQPVLEGGAPQPPQRGGRQRAPTQSGGGFHLSADTRNQRIVVAAPQLVIDEARKLVAEFDRPATADEPVVETVLLKHASATEMVRTLREMMGAPTRVARPGGQRGQGTPAAGVDTLPLAVAEAPGGGALVLRGTLEDVTRAKEWIARVDTPEVSGKQIKVYQIKYADPKGLAELILQAVDTAPAAGGRAPGQAPGGRASRGGRGSSSTTEEDSLFETQKKYVGNELYIQADLISDTLIVCATQAKLDQIDAVVAQFDCEDGELSGSGDVLPKMMYELKYADAFDASFDLDTLLSSVWEPRNQLPNVDYLPFDDVLVVRYTDESRFPEIEELIRKYVDKPRKVDTEPKRATFLVPGGMTAQEAAAWFKLNNPDVEVELVETGKVEDETHGIEQVRPRAQAHRCVLPIGWARLGEALLAETLALEQSAALQVPPGEVKPDDEPPPEDPTGHPSVEDDAVLDDAVQSLSPAVIALPGPQPVTGQTSSSSDSNSSTSRLPAGSKVKVYYDEKEGVLVFDGPNAAVKALQDSAKDLENEIKTLGVKPDIRVFRVRYIDVNTAAEIIDDVFNAGQRAAAQQQQQMLRQQQMAQRMAAQQAAQARRQGGQQGQPGQPGQQVPGGRVGIPQIPGMPGFPGMGGGRPGEQQGQGAEAQEQMEQIQQQMMAQMQTMPSGVQIKANPRDRTLIVRANTRDYPALLELLATIDQPQPIDSEFKIIQLKKLNAEEVEQTLKTLMGLDERAGRVGRTGRPGGGGAVSAAGALPQRLMQQTEVGELGIFKDDLTITSDAEANTILVMGPAAGIELVEKLVAQLESHELPERTTKYYELRYADAEELATHLTTQYTEGATPSGSRRGRTTPRPAAAGTPTLNKPTFLAYAPLNLLIVQAVAEDVTEVDELVARLDVADSSGGRYEPVDLVYADAAAVAETLTTMFAGGTARGGRGAGAAAAGATTKFIGEAGGNVLFFKAPASLREDILAAIQKIEAQYAEAGKLRVIQLQHAKPSSLVETIQAAYGARRGSAGARGRRGGTTTQLTITAHDASKQLFVIADEGTFVEIESLVQTLDKSDIGLEFRIYKMQYASARAVYTTMTALLTDYLRRAGGKSDIENFSVQVDDKANALIVLGSPTVFTFLEEQLAKVDIPANAPSPPGFLMVVLKNARATDIAGTINRLWSQRNLAPGETPPQAEANASINMLIVRGTQEQIEQIKKEIIDPTEAYAPPALLTETITLHFAQPEAVASSINQIFEDKRRAVQTVRGASAIDPVELTVVVTPEVNTGQIVVQASAANMELIKARVAELDKADVAASAATTMKIYPIKYADPGSVATIITQWARTRTTSAGRQMSVSNRDMVNAVAEPGTQTVVVTASEANHKIVAELISGLDDEKLASRQRGHHVIALAHANATEVANQLAQAFRQGRGVRGDAGPQFLPDVKTNSIVASVNDDEMVQVQELLTALDVPSTEETKRTMVVYPVKFAEPNSIVNIINQTYNWQRQTQPRPEDRVVALVEGATQSVIVTASLPKQEEIKQLIADIDNEATSTEAYESVPLKFANADEVVTKLTEVFNRQRFGVRRAEQQLIIASNPRANAVILRGSDKDITAVKDMITVLDVEEAADAERTTKAHPLKFADPGSINNVIMNMFRWDRRVAASPSEQVTCAVDWGTRSIIVTASAKNHDVIGKMLEQVDVESIDQKQVYTQKLKQANADDVARALQSAYRGRRTTGQGQQPVQITAEPSTNSLLIYASADEMRDLLTLIEQLDVEPETARQRQMQTIHLLYANPWSTQDAINQMFRNLSRNPRDQVTAVPEYGTNSVIVSASPENMTRVEDLITALDQAGTGQQQVQVIRIENADASAMARALNDIYVRSAPRQQGQQAPPITISEVQGSRAIIVKANETDMARVLESIKELDRGDIGVGSEIQVVSLLNSGAEEMLSVMQEYLRKPGSSSGRGGELVGDVRLSTLTQGNALVISGDKAEVERLVGIARDLDVQGKELNEPKLIKLQHANAAVVLPALQEMFTESRGRGGRTPSLPPVITVDENQNALLVRASAADMSAIQSAIGLMDTPEAGAKELLRIIPVPSGINVTDLASLLETQFNESADARGGTGSGRGGSARRERISIRGDTRTHALVVAGSATLFDEVDKVVQRLIAQGPAGGKATVMLRPTHLSADEARQLIERLKEQSGSSSSSSGGGSRSRGRGR